jgi:hypothetical protein
MNKWRATTYRRLALVELTLGATRGRYSQAKRDTRPQTSSTLAASLSRELVTMSKVRAPHRQPDG